MLNKSLNLWRVRIESRAGIGKGNIHLRKCAIDRFGCFDCLKTKFSNFYNSKTFCKLFSNFGKLLAEIITLFRESLHILDGCFGSLCIIFRDNASDDCASTCHFLSLFCVLRFKCFLQICFCFIKSCNKFGLNFESIAINNSINDTTCISVKFSQSIFENSSTRI